MQKIRLNIQRFASGTISQTSATSNKASVRIIWESSIISGENASNVTATVQILRATSGTTSCTFQGNIGIDGTSGSVKQYRSDWTTTWKTVGTFTKRVEHNANGTKSITIDTTIATADSSTSLSGTYKASGTVVLDSIDRNSILNPISNFKLSDTLNISIEKYLENANDNLIVSVNGTQIKEITGITNGYQLSFTQSEQNAIKALMTSPQIALTFTLNTIYNQENIGNSIQSAIVTSLDQPIYRNIVKKSNGHYQVAINGIVDEDDSYPLQVYSDAGAKILGDTGWQDFLWENSSFMVTPYYSANQWRVINGVLYINIGVGQETTINSSAESEVARIPITGNTTFDSSDSRIWIAAVGGGGAIAGFIVIQNQDYISIYLKPHTSSNAYAARWYASMIVIPLDDTAQINLSQLEVNE